MGNQLGFLLKMISDFNILLKYELLLSERKREKYEFEVYAAGGVHCIFYYYRNYSVQGKIQDPFVIKEV